MNKYVAILAISVALCVSACGGGGGGEPSVPILVIPPTVSENAIVVSAQFNSLTVSDGEFLVRFNGTTDVTISGDGNKVAFAVDQNSGAVNVGGNGNTLIFRPGDTVSTLTVTGSNNTVYIAEGSNITATGTPGSGLSVKRYAL
jgi:hypothetical protein